MPKYFANLLFLLAETVERCRQQFPKLQNIVSNAKLENKRPNPISLLKAMEQYTELNNKQIGIPQI